MNKLNVALHAWKHATPGLNEDMLGHTVVKTNKLLLVMNKQSVIFSALHKGEGPLAVDIVAFPKPEHVQDFQAVAHTLRVGGPAEENPGAVGTMRLRLLPMGLPIIDIDHCQAHFKTGGEYGLPRSLATKYGGWRKHSLLMLFAFAKQHNFPVTVKRERLYMNHVGSGMSAFHKDLLAAAREVGVNVKEVQHGKVHELMVNLP